MRIENEMKLIFWGEWLQDQELRPPDDVESLQYCNDCCDWPNWYVKVTHIILEILLLKTMAATSQAQKHAITLKGSTDIVAEFFRK